VVPVQADAGAANAQTAAIKEKLQGGIAITHTATVLVAPGKGPKDVGKADFDARAKALPHTLAVYFTGEILARYTDQLENALSNERDGPTRDISGGSRQLEITSLTANGNQASGTARSLNWLQDASAMSGKANPEMTNWWTYTFHLVHTTGGWRIDDLAFEPEPGSGP
jgi:hypothetical protein